MSPLLLRAASSLAFILVAIWPVIKRLRHPTFFGDDVTRLVDLIRLPFRELIFLPFAEHVAPLFQLVSWLMWQSIGHDIRLAPLGFTIASVVPWLLVLALLSVWLLRETGSRTATFIAVAIVAQSPLILETAWWYSASSFLWAIAGVLTAILGATRLAQQPVRALAIVALGAAIAPAGTSVGLLAGPLAVIRGLIEPGVRRRTKVLLLVAAIGGILAYDRFCKLGHTEVISAARTNNLDKLDLPLGFYYAVSVPGRVLWPVAMGARVSRAVAPQPAWYFWGSGALALAGTAAIAAWPQARWNRRAVLAGAAMIYMTYALIYPSRVCMMKMGRWTERQLLYEYAGRYHVLPILGLAAIVAAVLASWPLVRRFDRRPWLPALAGMVIGLVMLAVQHREAAHWNWMLDQPGQKETLAVLCDLGKMARDEGITRSQLTRIIAPAFRGWNQNLVVDRPAAFSLMNLVTLAPEVVAAPLGDDEARNALEGSLDPAAAVCPGCGKLCVPEPGTRASRCADPGDRAPGERDRGSRVATRPLPDRGTTGPNLF